MSGAVEGVALPDGELIYQALRFLFWSAGQGFSPINTNDAPEPEEVLWQYSLRTGDEEWETVAERYRASFTTPPARSYADGVADERARIITRAKRDLALIQGCMECNAEDERRWADTIRWLEENA